MAVLKALEKYNRIKSICCCLSIALETSSQLEKLAGLYKNDLIKNHVDLSMIILL